MWITWFTIISTNTGRTALGMIGERCPGSCTIMVDETPKFPEIIKSCISQMKANLNVDSPLTIKYTVGKPSQPIVDVKTTFISSGINSFQFRHTCISEAGFRKRRKKRRTKVQWVYKNIFKFYQGLLFWFISWRPVDIQIVDAPVSISRIPVLS